MSEVHELAVLNSAGDTKTLWDPSVQSEVDVARAQFNALRDKGFSIFRVNGDRRGERMDQFDPKAGKLIAVPRVVGG